MGTGLALIRVVCRGRITRTDAEAPVMTPMQTQGIQAEKAAGSARVVGAIGPARIPLGVCLRGWTAPPAVEVTEPIRWRRRTTLFSSPARPGGT